MDCVSAIGDGYTAVCMDCLSAADMQIVCIDPGIVSIGFVRVEMADGTGLLARVLECKAVDATMSDGDGKHVHDRIVQFFRDEHDALTCASVIVVERQPFVSAGMPLEIMLRERFGCKCVFFNPNSLHKMFGLGGYEYEGRKQKCVRIVMAHVAQWVAAGVPGAAAAERHITTLERKHDICDAVLLLLAWHAKYGAGKPTETKTETKTEGTSFAAFVAQFRYTKNGGEVASERHHTIKGRGMSP